MFSASPSRSQFVSRTARDTGFGFGTFAALAGLYRQRRALKDLDAHLLRDIGVTENEALTEAARPVWDVPQNWRL